MKIYYNYSLWNKGKGVCGLPQWVHWQFEYAGAKRYIPVVYRFPEGIVFDIITVLDETKLRKFFEKYEAIEESLTPLQRRCAEQNHPYQAVTIKEMWINGELIEGGYSSSSAVSIPWAQGDNILTVVKKAYPSILKDVACFACERFRVPYPETDLKIQKILRFFRLNRVSDIKLYTQPVQRFFPLDLRFEMLDKEDRKEISFVHPKTGITHTLFFQNAEPVEMPIGKDRKRHLHTVQSMYEIDPPLPQGDSLQFNSSIQYTEPPEDSLGPTAASSFGIIGGACGPTAVFAAVKNKNKEETIPRGFHGLPLHCCFSVPGFRKEDTTNLVLEGIDIKDLDSKEYSFK